MNRGRTAAPDFRSVASPQLRPVSFAVNRRASCTAGVPMIETRSAEPPPATLRALKEQTTQELVDALRQYAHVRATLVRRAGRPISETYARELVDDALADTRVGDLPWDPKCK